MTPPPQHVNLFFRLVIVAGGAFVATILAYVATIFGDPDAPLNRFLSRYALWMFAGESLAVIVLGTLGMIVDRRQTVRHLAEQAEAGSRAVDSAGVECPPSIAASDGWAPDRNVGSS